MVRWIFPVFDDFLFERKDVIEKIPKIKGTPTKAASRWSAPKQSPKAMDKKI